MKSAFEQYLFEENFEGSGKASSYLKALYWLKKMLEVQPYSFADCIDIWRIKSPRRLVELRSFVLDEQKKGDSSQWVRDEIPVSYLRDGYCSAALTQLISFLPAFSHAEMVLRRFEEFRGSESEIAGILNIEPEVSIWAGTDSHAKLGQDEIRKTKARIGQRTFREVILRVYNRRCCLTGLDVPALNRASHIIGWAENKKTRMDPSNGLCLSATYDAAFDRHLISLDEDYRLILSKELREYSTRVSFQKYFSNLKGQQIALPGSYRPKQEYLDIHRRAGCF